MFYPFFSREIFFRMAKIEKWSEYAFVANIPAATIFSIETFVKMSSIIVPELLFIRVDLINGTNELENNIFYNFCVW